MKKKSLIKRFIYSQKAAPYVFVSPFILIFLMFFAYPMINTVVMSFQKISGGKTSFVGVKNYQTLLNPVFIKCLKNSAFYTVVTCIIMIFIPMLLAVLLNSRQMKFKTFFRSIMFVPALTSIVVAGVVFRLMFGELEGSFMNQVLGFLGKDPIVWLRNPVTVWITLFLLCTWRWTGVNMMYYLSGLQQIPEDLFEASDIDGASSLQRFRYITLPLLKPTTVYVLTISIFGGMAMFAESYILFNGNKTPNNVATTIVGYLYRMGLEQNNIGIASAIGVVLLVIVMGINIIQLVMNGTLGKEE
ncbi:carbohydrate ABC transporter permease [Lacrimispora sphenoides]|uniref:Arabinosaccharide transport system permease protein n=1 Tax=Lacrimispora sphenoides JCM 1415 TaxID=1297793 RepID=A0ABY1C3U4_9FIRM|nr:sugar ABC transporter permease [Lacrimispora sphenoides]SET62086.1 arabinosaccharide transport system permease protein [[Clostridium] sphenoides JCM 1415]SUY50106.1 binding-protein-dependent transport system inner membrane protein [Lacrimispora sphenoides]